MPVLIEKTSTAVYCAKCVCAEVMVACLSARLSKCPRDFLRKGMFLTSYAGAEKKAAMCKLVS